MRGKYSDPNEAWYYGVRYDLKSPKNMKGCFCSLVGVVLIIIISLLLSSCQSIKYVPVETIRTEYITKTDTFIQRDSVHVKDSILIFTKGDSVFTDRWHVIYKDRLKEVLRTDTVFRTDSVQVPYPVEKQLSKWQKLKMDVGGILIVLCIILIVLFVGYVLLFKRR